LFVTDSSSAILGHHGPVLLADDQGGDAGDAVLLLEVVGQVGAVLHSEPVSVGLLHVTLHVLRRSVGGDEDNLNIAVKFFIEIFQHWSELSAGWAPVGREVVENQILIRREIIKGEINGMKYPQTLKSD